MTDTHVHSTITTYNTAVTDRAGKNVAEKCPWPSEMFSTRMIIVKRGEVLKKRRYGEEGAKDYRKGNKNKQRRTAYVISARR